MGPGREIDRLPHPSANPPPHNPAGGFISRREPHNLFVTITALSGNNVAFQIVFRLEWWIYKLSWWLGTEAG